MNITNSIKTYVFYEYFTDLMNRLLGKVEDHFWLGTIQIIGELENN